MENKESRGLEAMRRQAAKEKQKRDILFIATMILMSIYLIWRMLFTIPFQRGIWNGIFGILLIVAETMTVFTTFELFIQKIQKKVDRLELPVIPTEFYPDVDVFIATHNEPVDLLYKTVNACTHMDYPDKSKVHIYLCDDGNRQAVAELAAQFDIGYIPLAENKHAKSGNLNNALAHTTSPLIATFDADMIPQHTFLMKTVPYFLLPEFIKEGEVWRLRCEEDPPYKERKLGLIQTPQSFYNPDLFQFNLYAEQNIPNEQDFFSMEINRIRNASNAVAYTGSNTVISRQAMEEIGGFPYHTITEDFETSIRLQQANYLTYATNEVQAAGLTTTTISSMLKQRVRWARGIIQSLQNTGAIFSRKLPFAANITYLNSFLYWWSFFNRLVFILSPILFALFDFQIVNAGFWDILLFWLPSYALYSTAMRFLSGNIRNQRWSQVIDTTLMPYLILPTLLEILHIRETKFKVTNKNKENDQGRWHNFKFALPHILLLALSIAAMIRFVGGKYGWALVYSSIIIFWLAYNTVALCYAIFFMLGRPAFRKTERIQAEESVTVQTHERTYDAVSADLSETGMAFYSAKPIYVPEDSIVSLSIQTLRYKAQLEGSIVYVRQEKPQNQSRWRYAVSVKPLSEEDKRQYMQIIYDRIHSLPKQMNLWITAYDDVVRNIRKRIKKQFSDKRKLPRIQIAYPVTLHNGQQCMLHSFNYRYFSATGLTVPNGSLSFTSPSGIEVQLRRADITTATKGEVLLEVENLQALEKGGLLDKLLEELQEGGVR
ncbi:glycosyltransferase [Faecalicatena contorta]|uniref:Cellulose synthase (UDP-forming) n=1 Tax=Faecalicatena contorta TaxID=39482 RepID=A0A315ZP18_9FIRM|nr:glycosyltransferase [Faecalicatena contorta]PWJ47226.1 cellulose synthase (UDP-forming) [Faecalicatena contorta]SUQ16069.1 cellulose synthase (UDP-forming) [Faecalicatena contorta]